MKTAIDLDAFLPEEKFDLNLLSPGGIETGWIVTIAGPAHPRVIAFSEADARAEIQKKAAIETARFNGRAYTPDETSLEKERASALKFWSARIIGWTPVRFGGVDFEYSEDSIATLIHDPKFSLFAKQIFDAAGDNGRFMKRSAKP